MTTITARQREHREKYLYSPRWRLIRALRRRRFDGNQCEDCGKRVGLDVHHDSYGHKGESGIAGLLAGLRDIGGMIAELQETSIKCRACHDRYHNRRESP